MSEEFEDVGSFDDTFNDSSTDVDTELESAEMGDSEDDAEFEEDVSEQEIEQETEEIEEAELAEQQAEEMAKQEAELAEQQAEEMAEQESELAEQQAEQEAVRAEQKAEHAEEIAEQEAEHAEQEAVRAEQRAERAEEIAEQEADYAEQETAWAELEAERAEEIAEQQAEQQAELEAEQQAELEAEQQAELEAEQQAELEAEQQAELEAEQQAELEAEQQAELEAEQQAELEAEQQAELEAEQQAELEAEQQAELEAEQQAELEAEQQAELEAEQQAELEAERQAELEAEQQAELEAEQQAELEAESKMSPSELYEKGQLEMNEAQREAEEWADENGMERWSDGTLRTKEEDPSLSDYNVTLDGHSLDLDKDSLEGTKMMIGHYEYDDAQFANDVKWGEDYKAATDGLYSDNMSDINESMAGIKSANAEYKENQAETEKMADYMHWQRDSYIEEYNPNASEPEIASKWQSEFEAEQQTELKDESRMSPSELYEKGQLEMNEAQREAEEWADKNGMERWSDGTLRENYMESIKDAEAANQFEMEAGQRAALEADVQAQADALNKEYVGLMDRKQAAFDSAVDATNIEDRDRFANIQSDIGIEMEQVRSKIIENKNRLK